MFDRELQKVSIKLKSSEGKQTKGREVVEMRRFLAVRGATTPSTYSRFFKMQQRLEVKGIVLEARKPECKLPHRFQCAAL